MRGFRHGHRSPRSPTYSSWASMCQRCWNKNNQDHAAYSGMGYEPWREFKAFLADMGVCPDGMTLERLDNAKGYSPGNCAWRPFVDNVRNRTTFNKLSMAAAIVIRASSRSDKALAKRYNCHVSTIERVRRFETWT